jgi:CTP:phosphocholine cytidylyltransferase-like protein
MINRIEFVLPVKINSKLSLNSIYSGMHWFERKKQSQNLHELVKLELLSQKVPKKLFENPVDIEFFWNSLLDLDNHGYMAKLIIDGLKGYSIRDDSKNTYKK